MWCDRCGENDRASLGTDEHGLDCRWSVLCEGCRTELVEDQTADALLHAPILDTGPVTRSRVGYGSSHYRRCYGMPEFSQRSWRRHVG